MTSKQPAANKSPSKAQVAANKQNAQKSTGPRTAEGKQRSSGNAMRHGVHANAKLVIEDGPFAEDPAEVRTFMREMLEELDPRDTLETFRANRIAMLHLQERRVDALETSMLEPHPDVFDRRTLPRDHSGDEVTSHIEQWNFPRYETPPAVWDPEPDPDATRPWRWMVVWLRDLTKQAPKLPGLWDEEHEPETEDEWKRAFERTTRHLFPKAEALGFTLGNEMDARFEREERSRHEGDMRAANDALSQIDRCNAQRARITSQLGKQMAIYQLLRARVVEGDPGGVPSAKRTQSGDPRRPSES
jgi:hypothetical protein